MTPTKIVCGAFCWSSRLLVSLHRSMNLVHVLESNFAFHHDSTRQSYWNSFNIPCFCLLRFVLTKLLDVVGVSDVLLLRTGMSNLQLMGLSDMRSHLLLADVWPN